MINSHVPAGLDADAKRRPKAIRILALIVAVLTFALMATPAQAYPVADYCAYTLITVRGNSEPAGTGSIHSGRLYATGGAGRLQTLVNQANNDQLIPIFTKSLVYGATMLDNGHPTSGYIAEVAAGKAALTAEIEWLVSQCPYVNITLAGYSQGAHIIGDTISSYTSTLSATARQHITGVALYADPSYRTGESWNASTNAGTSSGIFARNANEFHEYLFVDWSGPFGPITRSTVRSWCIAGDIACQSNPGGFSIHDSGYTTSYFANGWTWLRDKMIDNG